MEKSGVGDSGKGERRREEHQVVTRGSQHSGFLSSRDSLLDPHGNDSMNGCVLPKVAHKPNRERLLSQSPDIPADFTSNDFQSQSNP